MEMRKTLMQPLGLYIDFPFCIARCAFCAFNVYGYREATATRYIHALQKEIAHYAEITSDYEIISLYFGGGTPTQYPAETLNAIVGDCYDLFAVSANAEVTVEAHPATLNETYLKTIRDGGINRLSIGAQSFSDEQLVRLGRHHTANDIVCAYDAARRAGFENIGMDLIYALPGQSLDEWEQTLQTAINLGPKHLSIYSLSIEKGTLFHKQDVCSASEADQVVMYPLAQQKLNAASFCQYEISNFAKPGYASVHNLLYWNRADVIGVGLSAHSYKNREHQVNTDSLQQYMEQIEAGCFPIATSRKIDAAEEQIDRIMFGLRKTEGIPVTWLAPWPERMNTVVSLRDAGYVTEREDRLQLTPAGMLMADEIAVALL